MSRESCVSACIDDPLLESSVGLNLGRILVNAFPFSLSRAHCHHKRKEE